MAPFDDFVHISTSASRQASGSGGPAPGVAGDFIENSSGQRLFTEGVIADSIRRYHPKHHLSVIPSYNGLYGCDLLAFGGAHDDVKVVPHDSIGLKERIFSLPTRRYNDVDGGTFADKVLFGTFDYSFRGTDFLLYIAEGADGVYAKTRYNYLLSEDGSDAKASAQEYQMS